MLNIYSKNKKNPLVSKIEDFNNNSNWEILHDFKVADNCLHDLKITYDLDDIVKRNCGAYQLNNAPHYIQYYKTNLKFLTNTDHPTVLKITNIFFRS